MTTRSELHRLVDDLPDAELHTARRFLVYLRNVGCDPLLDTLLAAPSDDEPETPEEAAAVAEAREDVAAGRTIPHAEVRRRFLLSE